MNRYIATILLSLLALSCSKIGPDIPEMPGSRPLTNEIDASCSVNNALSNSQGIATKGIIGQTTIASIAANFIKLDEIRNDAYTSATYKPMPFPGWDMNGTTIHDGKILASPDNTEGIHFRSIVFEPKMTYQMKIEDKDGNPDTVADNDTVAFTSRMVGWYPNTFKAPILDGAAAAVRFIDPNYDTGCRIVTENGANKVCVEFKKKLDGQTDLMMTDMREGRYDRADRGFKNNPSSDYDVQPFGHVFSNYLDPNAGYRYCNYFTFKHYLAGIRLFVRVAESDLSLISWDEITDVVFKNQPTTAQIELPTVQQRGTGDSKIINNNFPVTPTLPKEGIIPIFGEALESGWSDFKDIPIIKTPMSVNEPDHPEFADTPTYPVKAKNAISMPRTYLGYILVRPDIDTEFAIYTSAGVFTATIPTTIITGAGESLKTEKLLEAGHIYNILIDMKADGSLDVIIGNEDKVKYKNLSPYNKTYNEFEYSNCYIISPEMMKNGEQEFYDGFYFQAITPGRGSLGKITGTNAELYPKDMYFRPYSVQVLWQDQPSLITHTELVHDYVRFDLNPQCKTGAMKGNAVIGVYDKNHELLWSWHIWVTDKPDDIHYKFTANTNTDHKTYDFTVMDRNLGATKDKWTGTNDLLETYGLYYQWGRKDPSPGPASFNYPQSDMVTKPYYYKDEGIRMTVKDNISMQPNVETGAKNPLDIISSSQNNDNYFNDWLYQSVDKLWGFDPTQNKIVQKTIYDPCPYGYRVACDEFATMATYGVPDWNDFTKGVIIKGMNPVPGQTNQQIIKPDANEYNYFPYSGWKGHDVGRTDKNHAWFGVGKLGDYQDARISKTADNTEHHRGRMLILDGTFTVPPENQVTYKGPVVNGWGNRTSASPVRCIRYNKKGEEQDEVQVP